MSQRLAASIRALKRRVHGWRARRALAKVEKERQRQESRQRIESGDPDGFYEGVLAVKYELWQLGAEVKSVLPGRPGGGSGMLDGLRDTLAAVDEAAGDLNLDADGGEFDDEPDDERGFDPLGGGESDSGFDPWTAGEPRERQ